MLFLIQIQGKAEEQSSLGGFKVRINRNSWRSEIRAGLELGN